MKYQCNMCKGNFESDDEEWSDETARAEYAATFGMPVQDPNQEIVCDDCYKKVMGE